VGTLVAVEVRVAAGVAVGDAVGRTVTENVGVGVHTAAGQPPVLVGVGEAPLGVGLGVLHFPAAALAMA
jgi:hypothetical protein